MLPVIAVRLKDGTWLVEGCDPGGRTGGAVKAGLEWPMIRARLFASGAVFNHSGREGMAQHMRRYAANSGALLKCTGKCAVSDRRLPVLHRRICIG